jgi:integrase
MTTTFSTVHDLVTAYMANHIPTLKDSRPTVCKVRKYFGPLLPLPLESLTVPVIQGWVNGIRQHSAAQADGCLSILRTMINLAIEWELYRGPNIAQRVKRKRAHRRTRYVIEQERPALLREIDKEPLMIRLYLYIAYYVGCRPGEIRNARIEDLKLFETSHGRVGVWIKPMTKNGDEQQVPIPQFVCDLLSVYLFTLPAGQEYLFVNRFGRRPSKEWWHLQWTEVRRRAGLLGRQGIQQRDLRRTCATDLTEHLDLVSISKGVLNHRDLNTTQIYVQPINKKIIAALNLNVLTNRAHLQPQGGAHVQNTTVLEPVPVGVSSGADLVTSDSTSSGL